MSDQDLPYGKLSSIWGAIAVITLFPLSFISLSFMAKPSAFNQAFYLLFSIYLIAQVFNRIPIGYRWLNDLQSNLERLFFLISFSASVFLVLNPFEISKISTKIILVIAVTGILLGFTSSLRKSSGKNSFINKLCGGLAGLICVLPMPIFIYLNQWPLQP